MTERIFPPRPTRSESFWNNVEKTRGCWLWKAGRDKDGYGMFRWSGGHRASRYAFFLSRERMPQNFVLHRCDNPLCVRPDHLFEGTAKDNSEDMVHKGRSARFQAKKTHCPIGHPYLGHNVIVEVFRKNGKDCSRRHCRKCCAVRSEIWRQANRTKLRSKLKSEIESQETPQCQR